MTGYRIERPPARRRIRRSAPHSVSSLSGFAAGFF